MSPAARLPSSSPAHAVRDDALRAAAERRATPGVILGPFYPVAPAAAGDALWRPAAAPAEATATARVQPLEVHGRVLTTDGVPVAGALVEAWQADERGRYRHPSAGPAPADPGFIGYGAVHTDAAGAFRFDTLRPGHYGDGALRRAPHIHFQVTGRCDRLVTQMFFPDEPSNADDRLFAASRHPEALLASVVRNSPARMVLRWEIVLRTG